MFTFTVLAEPSLQSFRFCVQKTLCCASQSYAKLALCPGWNQGASRCNWCHCRWCPGAERENTQLLWYGSAKGQGNVFYDISSLAVRDIVGNSWIISFLMAFIVCFIFWGSIQGEDRRGWLDSLMKKSPSKFAFLWNAWLWQTENVHLQPKLSESMWKLESHVPYVHNDQILKIAKATVKSVREQGMMRTLGDAVEAEMSKRDCHGVGLCLGGQSCWLAEPMFIDSFF